MPNIICDQDHHYFVDGKRTPGVNEILAEVGLIDFSGINARILDLACNLGTATHQATALDDINDLDFDTLSPGLLPYVQAWQKFKADYKISFRREQIEQKLYSKKWGFCGTLDRLPVKIDRKMTLIDLKTCTSMQKYFRLTTAAYAILAEENLPRTESLPKFIIQQRWGVQLLPDGTFRIHKYENTRDRQYFLSELNSCQFRRE